MPKPKAYGHRQPHSRMGSSTSIVKLSALTPAHRQDSVQRLQLVQAAATQGLKQPPKNSKQNGRHRAQGAVLLQPSARRPATPPPPPAPARQAVESPSSTTEDEWESSKSGAVTPNPEPEPEPAPAPAPSGPNEPGSVHPALPPLTASDVTVMTMARPDEPSPATPKPVQKAPLLDTAIALLQNAPSSAPAIARQQQPPPLLASPTITPPPPAQAPHSQQPSSARRARPRSAIFPDGAVMSLLVPSRRDSVPALDDDSRARHRHSSSAHRQSLQLATASSSPPLSVHSISAFPASRPHPLLRGMSHSGASVGPLLTSDPTHATLSPNPASQPSSPNSERSRPGASSSMSISGRLLRRTSQSSIKSVATLPATSTVTALLTSPSASSTAENVNGTFSRTRNHSITSGSASAAVSSLAKASKSVVAPAPLWQTAVTFKSTHQYQLDGGGGGGPFGLLAPEVRARRATVARSHAPGIASFQRVVAQRMALSKRKNGMNPV
ncbi:hypothetical protein AURDEDRAFT_114829 [Auricularia subglabra TFB-10046 SS5]|nr:hypothetical protein AURDEDRAFT_114829 [Auricularia subglabra TFB-10046 SS5]